MQILYVYQHYTNIMVEFDYLQYSLVRLFKDSPLQEDAMPITPRESCYRIKKPRSSYADNHHV